MEMNKEQAYDEKIAPLMAQIIATCQEHNIAMVFSCDIPTEDEPDLSCTSCTPDESGNNPSNHLEALYALGAKRRPGLLLRTEHGDGSQTLTTFA